MRKLVIEAKITPRNMRGVEIYLNNLTRIPMLSPEQEVEIGMKCRKGDQKAITQLANANLRFVVSVAKQYQGYCNNFINLLDLIQAGNEGLMLAAQRFDPTRGFKFISFAIWYIRQRIQVFIDNNKTPVRLPLNLVRNNHKAKLIFEKADGDNSIEITDEIQKLGRTYHISITSFDQPIAFDSEMQFWEITPQTTEPQPDEFTETEHLQNLVRSLIFKLNDKHRDIIGHTFGVCGYQQLSPEQIAAKFNSSTNSIKQITRTVLKDMQRHAKNYRHAN